MRTSRLLTPLCLSLIVGLSAITAVNAGLFDLFGLLKSPRKAGGSVSTKPSLVVFPFDQDEKNQELKNVPSGYGIEVGAYLRAVLVGNPKYSVYLWSKRLSPMQRGAGDTTLKTEDLDPPYSEDKAKGLKLAQELAADYFLVGALDSYEYDPAQKVAQITLSAELFDGKTGKSIGKYFVAGKADASSKASDEDEYRAVAAGKAVDSLREQLLPIAVPEAKPAETKTAETPASPAPAPAPSAPPVPETK